MSPSGDAYPRADKLQNKAEPPAPAKGAHTGLMGYLLGALTTLAIVGGTQFLLRRPDPPPITFHTPPPPASPTANLAPSPVLLPTPTLAPLIIFVSGAVLKPGLYQLPAEARVGDAIAVAGGLAPDADPAVVNQAEKLWDGVQVHVPSMVEAQAMMQPPVGVSGSQPPAIDAPDTSSDGLSSTGPVNINQATLEQLDTLPGIGPAKGQAIIDNRPYATVDDLERVPGIGPSTIAQLRNLVTTE